MKQGLQGFLMITYFGLAWFTAYIAKKNLENWVHDLNEVRVMLFIEVTYIFVWIISSIIFTTSAQLFNFKSTILTEAALASDDNIWNDRGADDFLRYIKHDFFTLVYIISHFLMTSYAFLNNSSDYNQMGKRDSTEMNVALACIGFARLNEVLTQGYGLSEGESIPKLRSKSTFFTIYTKGFLWAMLFAVVGTIGYLRH